MKTLKRVFSIVLAIAVVLCMGVTALAADREKMSNYGFTVTAGGETMTEFTVGEVTDPYNGTVPLYTVTIPEGTTEVNITWNDGNNYTLSYYDANCSLLGFESGMQNSWTVAMDKNSDGEYDMLQVYDSGYGVPYWITFASEAAEEEPEQPATPFTVTVGGEAMSEFTVGEVTDPYNGTVPLYTVTIPAGTAEVNITWNDGNNYTLSYYDANCSYFGFESGMQNSWTVAMDKNSDGEYDMLQVYDSSWGVPYWITFASEAAEEEPAPALSVKASAAEVTTGDTVKITLSTDAAIENIFAFQMDLYYDAELFELVSATGDCDYSANTDASGNKYIRIMKLDLTGKLSLEGDFMTFEFKTLKDGEYSFDLSTVKFSDSKSAAIKVTEPEAVTVTICHEHIWDDGEVTTAPTCEETGVKTFKCTVTDCTETKTEEVAATGHTYDEGVVTTEPTCEEAGVKTYTCECGDTKTEEVAATGHTYDEGVVTTEPTCEEAGVKTYTCECGDTKTEEVAATGHTWDEGVVTTEPTVEAEGEKTYTCSVCGDTKVEPIDKLTPPADEEGDDEGTTTPPSGGSTTPDTGDNSMLMLYIIVAVLCLGGITFLVIKKKQLSK